MVYKSLEDAVKAAKKTINEPLAFYMMSVGTIYMDIFSKYLGMKELLKNFL